MTAARLNELAKWAEFQSVHCQIDGSIDASVKYADLARCARAWAKVERMSRARTWWWNTMMGRLVSGYGYKYSTAIAAVEAAPEVKP